MTTPGWSGLRGAARHSTSGSRSRRRNGVVSSCLPSTSSSSSSSSRGSQLGRIAAVVGVLAVGGVMMVVVAGVLQLDTATEERLVDVDFNIAEVKSEVMEDVVQLKRLDEELKRQRQVQVGHRTQLQQLQQQQNALVAQLGANVKTLEMSIAVLSRNVSTVGEPLKRASEGYMKMVRWELQGKIREGVEDLSKQLAVRLERLEAQSGVGGGIGGGRDDGIGIGNGLGLSGLDFGLDDPALPPPPFKQRGGSRAEAYGVDPEDPSLEEDLFRQLRADDRPARPQTRGAGGLLSWLGGALGGANAEEEGGGSDSNSPVEVLKRRRREARRFGGGGGGVAGSGEAPPLFVSHEAPIPPWQTS